MSDSDKVRAQAKIKSQKNEISKKIKSKNFTKKSMSVSDNVRIYIMSESDKVRAQAKIKSQKNEISKKIKSKNFTKK